MRGNTLRASSLGHRTNDAVENPVLFPPKSALAFAQKETWHILRRDLELLADFTEMGFRQPVCEPRHHTFGT